MQYFKFPNPYDPEDDCRRKALADLLDFLVQNPGVLQACQTRTEAQQDFEAATRPSEEPDA